jgi:hypothetical protein
MILFIGPGAANNVVCRKRPKLFVPDESKDGRYWEKRGKNNVVARRSREARRLKENQIPVALRY